VFQHVDQALALDSELVQQMQDLQQQQPAAPDPQQEPAANTKTTSSGGQAHGSITSPDAASPLLAASKEVDHAEDLQPLAEHLSQQVQMMHAQWRSALDARTAALTDCYRMGDELREAREATHQAAQALTELQREHVRVQGQLEASQVRPAAGTAVAASSSSRWHPQASSMVQIVQCCSLPNASRAVLPDCQAGKCSGTGKLHNSNEPVELCTVAYACRSTQLTLSADCWLHMRLLPSTCWSWVMLRGSWPTHAPRQSHWSEGEQCGLQCKQLHVHVSGQGQHCCACCTAGVASWSSKQSSCSWTLRRRSRLIANWNSAWQPQQAHCSASTG
jgi:hypothetical protein